MSRRLPRVSIKVKEFELALVTNNYNQAEFANLINVSSSYISSIKYPEKTSAFPSSYVRAKILDALGRGYKFDDIFYVYDA